MATVTGLTAERMQEIIDATITDADIIGDHLILTLHDASTIDAGYVTGPVGPSGGAFTICTSGTRPGSPTAGLAIYETDTKLVRIWNGTRWRLQERVICTNATRPAALGVNDEGTKIYETDTNLEYIWSGAAWVSASNLLFPVGIEIAWPGLLASIPAGFLHENGSVVLRATYPDLFAVLGTSWNTGGESGLQFRLPDSRNRFVVGAGSTYSLGQYGGEATHVLTTGEMPSHTHSPRGSGTQFLQNGAADGAPLLQVGGSSYALGTGTGATGGGGAHNNIPPYAGKYILIRAQ